MAIKDRAFSLPVSEASTFTCPDYSPELGGKRCRHYLANGSCTRPDQLMCVEWLKVNQTKVEPPPVEKPTEHVPRDLFGAPLSQLPTPTKKVSPDRKPVSVSPPPTQEPEATSALAAPLVRNLTDEEITSFKDLGAEVCLTSENLGEIWIVPEYTEQPRQELSVAHAATLNALCAAFPGAKVTAFEKKTSNTEPLKFLTR